MTAQLVVQNEQGNESIQSFHEVYGGAEVDYPEEPSPPRGKVVAQKGKNREDF
jgi:hypothetical protein